MPNWERSFPLAQLEDHSWMINALEDMADYCKDRELGAIELEIRQILERITSKHSHLVSASAIDVQNHNVSRSRVAKSRV